MRRHGGNAGGIAERRRDAVRRRHGRRVWRTCLQGRDPVQPLAIGDRNVTNVVTAIALANMSAQEIEHALELLADYAADRLVARLARGLDAARR